MFLKRYLIGDMLHETAIAPDFWKSPYPSVLQTTKQGCHQPITNHWPDGGLMLGGRLQCWPNIKPSLSHISAYQVYVGHS